MTPRSWLLIPADRPERMREGLESGADALILDLEDSVPVAAKPKARDAVRDLLKGADRSGPELWVRINPLATDFWRTDVDSVLMGRAAGIVLPKALPEEVDFLSTQLDTLEPQLGLAHGSTGILPMTETAPAVLALTNDTARTKRMVGLTWGVGDLSVELGTFSARDEAGRYTPVFEMARSLTIVAAAAAGVAAIETAFPDFRDQTGLAAYGARGRRDGFVGMIAIHPTQVPIINAAFEPTELELSQARAVVAAFEGPTSTAATSLDGKMLYAPHLAQARRILEWGRRKQ